MALKQSGDLHKSWPDNLIWAIVGDSTLVAKPTLTTIYQQWLNDKPADFDASLEYVLFLLARDKGEKKRDSILLYFKEDLTLQEAAAKQDITRERVRQNVAIALAYMRNPKRFNILCYGVSHVIEQTRQEAFEAGYRKSRKENEMDVQAAYIRGRHEALSGQPVSDPTDMSTMFRAMETPLKHMRLNTRAENVLTMAGYTTIGQILYLTDSDLLSMRNCGMTTMKYIRNVITQFQKKHAIPQHIQATYLHQNPVKKKED